MSDWTLVIEFTDQDEIETFELTEQESDLFSVKEGVLRVAWFQDETKKTRNVGYPLSRVSSYTLTEL